MTDAAAHSWEGVFLLEQFECLIVFSFVDQSDIPLNADMGRAGCLTRGCPSFAYAERTGNCLRVLFEDSPSEVNVFIVFIGEGNRAYLGTLTAACTLEKVYVTWSFVDFCSEVSRLAIES
jgi:hypothetical protein